MTNREKLADVVRALMAEGVDRVAIHRMVDESCDRITDEQTRALYLREGDR